MKLILKLCVEIFGYFYLIFITKNNQLGQFPEYAKWFDDYRARKMNEISKLDRYNFCVNNYGKGHCDMFLDYNHTWWGRYVWSAFRNSTNYFVNVIIAKKVPPYSYLEHDGNTAKLMCKGLEIAREYKRIDGNEIKVFNLFKIRCRFGYKIEEDTPSREYAEYAFSIGIRKP